MYCVPTEGPEIDLCRCCQMIWFDAGELEELPHRTSEELATEQKLLDEARAAYANGSPQPTLDEQNAPQRYADRVGRLRQAVSLHEKNIEALNKELAAKR